MFWAWFEELTLVGMLIVTTLNIIKAEKLVFIAIFAVRKENKRVRNSCMDEIILSVEGIFLGGLPLFLYLGFYCYSAPWWLTAAWLIPFFAAGVMVALSTAALFLIEQKQIVERDKKLCRTVFVIASVVSVIELIDCTSLLIWMKIENFSRSIMLETGFCRFWAVFLFIFFFQVCNAVTKLMKKEKEDGAMEPR